MQHSDKGRNFAITKNNNTVIYDQYINVSTDKDSIKVSQPLCWDMYNVHVCCGDRYISLFCMVFDSLIRYTNSCYTSYCIFVHAATLVDISK